MGFDSPDAPSRGKRQLTFDVEPHPHLKHRQERGEYVFLTASLELSVDVPVTKDMQSGDKFLVTILGEDGEMIARRYGEVTHPSFPLIREKKIGVIGQNRTHHAKLTDDETF